MTVQYHVHKAAHLICTTIVDRKRFVWRDYTINSRLSVIALQNRWLLAVKMALPRLKRGHVKLVLLLLTVRAGEDDKEFGGPPDSNRSSLTHYNPIPSKGDTLFAVSPPRKIVPTNLSSTNTSPFTTSTMTEFVVVADGA
jgi:hypothetical protein